MKRRPFMRIGIWFLKLDAKLNGARIVVEHEYASK